jgi:cobalamin-dependent methionine synthase I
MGNKPNSYLAMREKIWNEGFQAGLKSGRQQIMDMTSLALRDPQYVKKDIFGGGRLVCLWQCVRAYIDKYQLAWEMHDETDHVQKQLDSNLAEAYGEALHDSFHERYPYAPKYDYKKGKWK